MACGFSKLALTHRTHTPFGSIHGETKYNVVRYFSTWLFKQVIYNFKNFFHKKENTKDLRTEGQETVYFPPKKKTDSFQKRAK